MIKEREPLLERMSVFFQVILTLIVLYISVWSIKLVNGQLPLQFKDYLIVSYLIAPIWYILLELFDLGVMARIQRYRQLIQKYFGVIAIGSILLFTIIKVLELEVISKTELVVFAISDFIVLFAQKSIGRTILKYFRRRGYNTRMTLIIADETSTKFIDQVIDSNQWGYLIGGIISDSQEIKKKYGEKYSIIPAKEDFANLIDNKVIDEVFFCKKHFKTRELNYYVKKCREVGVIFHLQSDVLRFDGLNPGMSVMNHQFFLSFRNTPENYLALMVKRGIDYLLAIFILLVTSPVMALITLLIKLEDGGPVFFVQTRVGKNGRHFKCLKFRTMVENAEDLREALLCQNEQDGPVFKIKDDPRITKIGKILRKTSLDEFPQFLNVLMGDMSIVGPRPPIPSEVKQYKRSVNRRLSINPGITCTWQVSGRNKISFDRWMEMDMEYIDNWSLKLDFIIMFKTFKVIFSGNGQ
ncbi:MAG: sugar transferase [Prolixibacteraceae bacterium]|nr:sugar transferase [Prolixibacteraceae bacterium]